MTPIGQMTIGETISSIRDLVFVFGVLTVGWKIRSWIQPGIDFFKRANNFFDISEVHMKEVQNGMETLLGNHLHHIEADLGHLSGRELRNPNDVTTVADKSS